MTTLSIDPNIAASPNYVGGTSMETIKEKYGLEDVIKLASNESMLPPSPRVIAAIQQEIAGLNRYPATMGDQDVRATLAESIGQGTSPENFVTGNGGCDVLNLIATGYLKKGDECIICRPTFPVYDLTARRRGAKVVYVDLDPEQFSYDVEAILGAVTEQTRIIYLCTPNNPTGTLLTAEQMETLVNNIPPQVLLVSDEVYHHFATDPTFPRTIDYVGQSKNVIIVHSLSKVFGLAGMRFGYGMAPAEIATYLSRARLPFHLNKLTMAGAKAALMDETYIEKTRELTVSGRDWLTEQLQRIEGQVWPSQSNFVLMKPPFESKLVADRLEQRGVIVRPLDNFYLPGYLRVTVGLPKENERFIKELRNVFAELA
ncbi:MAG: histidinol-phosphate transaminase [Anaerolineae bacterium]|nr:histidinol-phosphate transaminase [Anaerolineae bacterium]